MSKKPTPLPPLVEAVARALDPIDWKYLNHEDDNQARKRRRTGSIRQARHALKALGIDEHATLIPADKFALPAVTSAPVAPMLPELVTYALSHPPAKG